MKLTHQSINDVEKRFTELSKKLKEIREENGFNEINLNYFQLKLTQITKEFLQPSNISIQQDSQEFIKKISVISSFGMFIQLFHFNIRQKRKRSLSDVFCEVFRITN
ncbi:unnamed protein product [Adineta steineri]|uniref:Uncharacterized protein n=1 Tax=Adineta steineri TaxID=433720 RepID=A0A813WSQ5_9BILA|nr:unnamed protein product [Adineta steineri]CAF0854994.1 unnamed protein product [Adineta steineri]CAF0899762.1 unnamed protein product [Adineta steineri]CAF3865182.1 unnamed protein product [Adineta steineri]CAF3967006.1 unnamed protein product [Adineta steineri]